MAEDERTGRDGAVAAEVYAATFEEPASAARRWRDRAWWLARVAAASIGVYEEPTYGDVVVRRRDDGTEVLRLGTVGAEEASYLHAEVERQLAEETVAAFEERWALTG